ncbi:MAG: hypothetical protein RLZZ142_1906 [Verrucomicrobiota bacterium]|jgi:hypothetical protein
MDEPIEDVGSTERGARSGASTFRTPKAGVWSMLDSRIPAPCTFQADTAPPSAGGPHHHATASVLRLEGQETLSTKTQAIPCVETRTGAPQLKRNQGRLVGFERPQR